MRVYLIDGTYELFRAYHGAPSLRTKDGREVGATRVLLRTFWNFMRKYEAEYVACAFDHVIESFRNELYAGYKTGVGLDLDLLSQFPLAEKAAHALGMEVWPMVEFEADDAIASGAARYSCCPSVTQVVLCATDKDLTQCVVGNKVVCFDRARERTLDHDGVIDKFGVEPVSIPDWLALVGDSADGYPGVPRWGAKSAACVLAHYKHIDAIPDNVQEWAVAVRGADSLARSLSEHRADAQLFRRLATLRTDAPIPDTVEALRWRGARRAELDSLCDEIGETRFAGTVDV